MRTIVIIFLLILFVWCSACANGLTVTHRYEFTESEIIEMIKGQTKGVYKFPEGKTWLSIDRDGAFGRWDIALVIVVDQ